MSIIQYAVEGCDLGLENAFNLDGHSLNETHEEFEVSYLAEIAAQDYWDNHDGWESSWPMDIEIFSDGKSMGIFPVYMESVPRFGAGRRKTT